MLNIAEQLYLTSITICKNIFRKEGEMGQPLSTATGNVWVFG
jgi:hypothetical protein